MVGLRSIRSKCASVLSLRPAGVLKSQTAGVVLALRSTAQKLARAARRLSHLLSTRLSHGLARLRRITALQPSDAIVRPLRPGRVRDFVTRFHPLVAASQRWGAWAADARGFWIMHQEAGGRKRGAEQTKDVDALGSAEKEHEALVRAAEKSLRKVGRVYHGRVEAAARRLGKAQAHKARRLCRRNGVLLYEDRIQTPRGVARFADGPVQATVHFPPFIREPHVMVDTPGFVSVVLCRPRAAAEFVERINQAVALAPQVAALQAYKVSEALARLESIQLERDEQIVAAEGRLEAARRSFVSQDSASSG